MEENARRFLRISPSNSEEQSEKDEVRENINKLLAGDSSGLLFLNSYFNLTNGRSFTNAENLGQMLSFLLISLCQNQSMELSYRSLVVIKCLLQNDNFLHSQFFFRDEFIQKLISLFSFPDKQYGILALSSLRLLIDSNKKDNSYLKKCLQFGYLSKMPEILNFPDPSLYDPSIEKSCIKCLVKSVIPICKKNIKECNPFIFQLSIDFIFSENSEVNSAGLEILKSMIEHGFVFEVNENIFQRFLVLAEFGNYDILNSLFELISNIYHHLPDSEGFLNSLEGSGFFLKIINRIETESSCTSIIFAFLNCLHDPTVDDPVIMKLMEILEKGRICDMVEGIKYLHKISYDMPTEFLVFLASNGIFKILSNLIECKFPSDVNVMSNLYRLTNKIVNAAVASGCDLESFDGSDDLVESLQRSYGESNDCYTEKIIEQTLEQFSQ